MPYEYNGDSAFFPLCLVDLKCSDNIEWLRDKKTTLDETYAPDTFNHTYGAEVSYECGIARAFDDGMGDTVDFQVVLLHRHCIDLAKVDQVYKSH